MLKNCDNRKSKYQLLHSRVEPAILMSDPVLVLGLDGAILGLGFGMVLWVVEFVFFGVDGFGEFDDPPF